MLTLLKQLFLAIFFILVLKDLANAQIIIEDSIGNIYTIRAGSRIQFQLKKRHVYTYSQSKKFW